jgi:hypothetical protein
MTNDQDLENAKNDETTHGAKKLAGEPSWFDVIFTEYQARGEAMFAFSRDQVERQGPTWDVFQREWVTVGDAGLHVKRSIRDEFLRRLQTGLDDHLASLPELAVTHIGTDYWDRPVYQDESGRRLVDVALHAPNEAIEFHTVTSEGEPIAPLAVRPVFMSAEVGTQQ